MRKKTPQEKKSLSYAKDCRNIYGENDKTSRIAIRKNKTFPNRAFRKHINDTLQSAIGAVDLEKAESVDVEIKEIKRRKWKKVADAPLGQIIRGQIETGERPIRRRLNGAMKNAVKEENAEWVRTTKGWMTKKR